VEDLVADLEFHAIFDSATSFTYINDPAYTRLGEIVSNLLYDRFLRINEFQAIKLSKICLQFNSMTKSNRHSFQSSKYVVPFEFCYDIRWYWVEFCNDIFFIVKAFATGAILATEFIHLLPVLLITWPHLLEGLSIGDFPFTEFVPNLVCHVWPHALIQRKDGNIHHESVLWKHSRRSSQKIQYIANSSPHDSAHCNESSEGRIPHVSFKRGEVRFSKASGNTWMYPRSQNHARSKSFYNEKTIVLGLNTILFLDSTIDTPNWMWYKDWQYSFYFVPHSFSSMMTFVFLVTCAFCCCN